MSKGKRSMSSRSSRSSTVAPPRAVEVEGEGREAVEWLRPLLAGEDAATETSRIMPVLAEELNLSTMPRLQDQPPDLALRELAEGVGCKDVETNLCSWWKMDWWSAVCREARRKQISEANQAVILQWLEYILKWISIDGLEREELFSELAEAVLYIASRFHTGNTLPLPKDIFRLTCISREVQRNRSATWDDPELKFEYLEEKSLGSRSVGSRGTKHKSQGSSRRWATTEKKRDSVGPEQDTKELAFLTKTIYDMFGNKFMYETIRMTYLNPPEIIPVTIVQTLQVPKTLKQPEKISNAVLSRKRSVVSNTTTAKARKSVVDVKGKKSVAGSLVKEPTRLPSFLQENINEKRKQEDLRERTKNEYLLSLADSVDNKFFERLFPASKLDKSKKGAEEKRTAKK